jgi:hypothetical protein
MTRKTYSRRLFSIVFAMLFVIITPAPQSQSSSPNQLPLNGSGEVVRIASHRLDHPYSTKVIAHQDVQATAGEWKLLMAQGFESIFPSTGWDVFDDDGATNGEYYWDDDDYRQNLGGWSAWCANGGADGLDPELHYYRDNMKSWMVYGPFDLSDYSAATVGFYYWNDSEPNYDWFSWEASIDGWNFYGSPSGSSVSGDSGGWTFIWFDLTNVHTIGNLAGRSQVWITFIFESDGSLHSYDGAFVDDIALWGYSEGQSTYLPVLLNSFPPTPRYPNDLGGDWRFEKVQAPQAWGYSTGDGAVIAIIDNGVDLDHGDLDDTLWTNPGEIAGNGVDDDGNGYTDDVHGYDFKNDDGDPSESPSHGTGVALVAAAETDNVYASASMGWNAQIMALRIGDAESWNPYVLDDAIRYAADNGADVINMSLHGGYACSTFANLQPAIDYARGKGVVMFAAGDGDVIPANCKYVIGVSATDENDAVATPGAGSVYIDVAAPGSSPSHTTSSATPMAAGLAALIKARHPAYTADQIADAIVCNADDIGDQDGKAGNGRVNAYRSLANSAAECSYDWED